MIRKILDGLAIVSFLLSVSVVGSGVFGYFWITKNQENLKQQLIEQVTGSLNMPDLSGPVLPTAKPKMSFQISLDAPLSYLISF